MEKILSSFRITSAPPTPPAPDLSHLLEQLPGDQQDRKDFRRTFSKEVTCTVTDGLDSCGAELPGISDDENIQPQIARCLECCDKGRIKNVQTDDFKGIFNAIFGSTCIALHTLLKQGANAEPVKLSGKGLNNVNMDVRYKNGNIVLTNQTTEGRKTLITLFLVTNPNHGAPPAFPTRATTAVISPVMNPASPAVTAQPPLKIDQPAPKSILLSVARVMEEGNEKKGFESVLDALTKVDEKSYVYQWLSYYQSRGIGLTCSVDLDSGAPQWAGLRKQLIIDQEQWDNAEKILTGVTNHPDNASMYLNSALVVYECLEKNNFPEAAKKCQEVRKQLASYALQQ